MWSFKMVDVILRKTVLLTLAGLLYSAISVSQSATKEDVIKKMEELARKYKGADHLSFDVKYRYAAEQQPTKYLDSMQGSFRLNGTNYWYQLDNTEFVANDSMMLTVFKEDKVIFINGTSITQSAMPTAVLDSVLLMNQYNAINITQNKQEELIQVDFAPGFMYKNVQYVIDAKTGFLKKVIATIHSVEMYDPAVKEMFENKNEFGILEMVFSNYRTKSFDKTAFSSEKYLRKSGTEVRAGAAYSDYRIYNSILKK